MDTELLRDIPVLRLERCSPEKSGLVLAAYLAQEDLQKAAARLLERDYFLEDISMVEVSEGFLGVYHFDHFEMPGRIALRVLVEKEAAVLPSISKIYDGAAWHERECRDFYGVTFPGHDNLTPLLLSAEDEALHPLRKETKSLKKIMDLIEPGDVLKESPGFSLFAVASEPDADAPPEAQKKATTKQSTGQEQQK
ncbi:NADH-quinone oxidoreductase subunit C [Desulfonatronum thiosulfatophilum]|uniref:NADH-quinone oxidoreductase subunit C n=1 Tax=Desulfonatronum thiosulfatophilum TaxID=617002 RepID=A0A1G6BRN3_9BACT|nr:NADH-quinone oxidoreductase subunit C [Desulfonatronum thiosulfatophilum]SDB23281.1 NADH-quinone oxidoreductase subunit C [Desulfonatronum thiosulfatophilum]